MIARAAAILVSVAGAWLAWSLAGDALAFAGLDEFDIPGRVAVVFVVLNVLQAVMSRCWRSE